MNSILEWIFKNKIAILIVFIAATVICGILGQTVVVNYDLADYLPDNTRSMIGLDILKSEYSQDIPNVRAMVPDISLAEALEYKKRLAQVDGVKEVNWLDDAVDVNIPLEMLDKKTVETWYLNNNALYSLTLDTKKQIQALDEIREIIGPEGALSGSSVNTAVATTTTESEGRRVMFIVVPIVFIILLLTTSSWFEPILFLGTIGIAIVLNMGTNAIMGEISFVSKAAGSILQLAVSMDYSIFLLHRYSEFRNKGLGVEEAIIAAARKAFTSILACGMATAFGFAALMIMKFKIGPDLGLVLAKSIILSIICVLILLPILTVLCHKLIEKTHHRNLIPDTTRISRGIVNLKVVSLVIFIVITPFFFLVQSHNGYYYGSSHIFDDPKTRVAQDRTKIESVFGKSLQVVLMVPKGDFAKERSLSNDIKTIPEVTSTISYVDSVGAEIPTTYLPEKTLSKLISEHYSRFVLTLKTDYEGTQSFNLVNQIRAKADQYYGDSIYLVGENVTTYDMKFVVTEDNTKVDFLSMAAILLILLINFRGLILSLLLILVIKSSVWVNLSVPYFTGDNLFYVAYLICSCLQLGATVDYGILFGNRYVENRAALPRWKAAVQTITDTSTPILTSAMILFAGGTILGVSSSSMIIKQLGLLVGRGALISAFFVLVFLPVIMALLDKVIEKTSWRLKFRKIASKGNH